MTSEIAEAAGGRLVSKDELFRQADIVTIHLILSARTKDLVGAAELELIKPTARLINTSRGPIVDEPSLIKALQSHTIAGAAIDVFDEEPLPAQHPFRSMDNVLATPHIGYVSENLYRTFYGDTMIIEKSLIDSALRGWKSNVERADKLFGALSPDQLEQEVAPGRNRLIYLWGHLAAVNDGLLPLLGIGERLHLEFDGMFISNPDKSVQLTVSGQSLKAAWRPDDGLAHRRDSVLPTWARAAAGNCQRPLQSVMGGTELFGFAVGLDLARGPAVADRPCEVESQGADGCHHMLGHRGCAVCAL